MLKILTTLVAFFTFASAQSQDDGDSVVLAKYSRLYKEVDRLFKLESSGELQFALWCHPSITNAYDLFWLGKKAGAWEARYFECRDGADSSWKELTVSQSGLDELWIRLAGHKVLELPTESDLKYLHRKYSIDTAEIRADIEDSYRGSMMTDGITYVFAVKSAGNFRAYTYSSPAHQLKDAPNGEPYFRAAVIINLVYMHLGRPMPER